MRPVPVEIEEVAILQPQALTLTLEVGGRPPQRPPQCLQVRVAEAEGGFEQVARRGHDALGGK